MTQARKVVLITGGSRGIGAETAKLASARGWNVALSYASDRQAAEQVAGEVERAGGEALAVRADVGVEADIVDMFAAVHRRFGRLDGLVNNAGIVAPKARVDEYTADRTERLMRVNVVGPILCAREAVRRMSPRHGGQGGAIVNVSSVAAVLGSANEYVDYAASKGAIDSFTVGLAREVATEAIRVNAVRPGTIDTEIHASGGQPDRVARVRESIPMKREGRPEEIASAIVWLLSDEASYITGALLDAGGGR
jgi:NAD(P)-dependent dehydrogenase (short-subunit alcohol dehydrogenase family)